jgi:hypothetical protein
MQPLYSFDVYGLTSQARWEQQAQALIAWHEAQRTASAEPVGDWESRAMFVARMQVGSQSEKMTVAEVSALLNDCDHCVSMNTPQPSAEPVLSDDARLGREARMRAAGMAGLLSEILGCGALSRHGDPDLVDRVKMACADQDAAIKERT